RPAVSKNSSTALSSHEGAFATSTTTRAPVSASANPSPVTALTPVEGEAATTLCPRSPRSVTSFFPMSPLPPITTIFMLSLLACRPASGAIIRLPPPTSGTACPGSGSWTPPRARPGCAASLLLLRDDDVLGVVRVKHNSDHPRLVLVAGVLRDPGQASGRLVERIPCLQLLDGFVVDGPLVLALQDVAERRAGVAVRRAGLARPQGRLDRRCLRLPPVDLFGDVFLGERLHAAFAVLGMLRQGHPGDRESTEDNRQQGASHDSSSDRTKVCSPLGNKDVVSVR